MSNNHHLQHRHARRDALPEAAPEPLAAVVTEVVYTTATPTSAAAATTANSNTVPAWVTAVINGDTVSWSNPAYTADDSSTTAVAAAKTTKTSATATTSSKSTTAAETTSLSSSVSPTTSSTNSLVVASSRTTLTTSKSTKSSSSTATAASSTSSSTIDSTTTSTGMSTGGKAGLAIGIVVGIFAILAVVFLVIQKRKKSAERERLDDEKVGGNADFSGAARAASQRRAQQAAPRLSLRPVTQLNPFGERRTSRANMLTSAAPKMAQSSPMSEKPAVNPFGNHAETLDSPNTTGPAMVQSVTPGGEVIMADAAVVAAGAAAGTAAGGLTRKASKRTNTGPGVDLTQNNAARGPASPTGTEFSMNAATTGAAAIAQAGGPPNSAVHRVQLDFVPSMEDELDLKAGQLIRVLHEYDDGWALCIRLDRSKQGVVPRTCLSTRPVKPRPQQGGPRGPPPPGMRGPPGAPMHQGRPMNPNGGRGPQGPPPMNQGQRPMTPNGGRGPQGPPPMGQGQRPMTPTGGRGPQGPLPMGQGQRPMTPTGGRGPQGGPPPMGQGQRPMTPTGGRGPQGPSFPQNGRPASPGPNGAQGRPRSPSVNQAQQPRGPPGPSPMNPNPASNIPTIVTSAPDGTEHMPTPGQAM